VVREYCGHGIGQGFHEEPQVLHYGRPGTGELLRPGMTFTIEPMINAGRAETGSWVINGRSSPRITASRHSGNIRWPSLKLVSIFSHSMSLPLTEPAEFDRQLLDLEALDARLQGCEAPAPVLRAALDNADQVLAARFLEGSTAAELVPTRALVMDAIVTRLWQHCLGDASPRACLAAVGGYGRGELHPASDTDLMVIVPPESDAELEAAIGCFVTLLWDIGIEVGHSVRSVDECIDEAEKDITVATNIMEARPLIGDESLFTAMQTATDANHVWPGPEFFAAKWAEQQKRHERYHDTAYNLEPNLKESPGGLRDIHMVGWVAKRHFNAQSLGDLVDLGFLTETEHEDLIQGQHYLWDLRFALHLLAGRREDRLLFEYQTELARQFGYKDAEHTLAVEQFMQRYYRTIMRLNRLNEMLLQLYQETILLAGLDEKPQLE